jgi:hypothetical protein
MGANWFSRSAPRGILSLYWLPYRLPVYKELRHPPPLSFFPYRSSYPYYSKEDSRLIDEGDSPCLSHTLLLSYTGKQQTVLIPTSPFTGFVNLALN